MHGGDLVAEVLKARGVQFLFTLCGGHISPILVGAKRRGIRVVDVRHEVNAVFAADAVSRLTGVPGVAAVTAGPGVTNTITALKNAQLAHSPLVLLGGATATMLRGRGSLQDINQRAVVRSCVKWMASVKRVRDLVPALERAFDEAQSGVPGPVFVELPVDLLYDRELVRSWYVAKAPEGREQSLRERALGAYLRRHVQKLFAGADLAQPREHNPLAPPLFRHSDVQETEHALRKAERPVLLVGSQALAEPAEVKRLAEAVRYLELPTYLSGMARGLLGSNDRLQLRHKRREALREADLVILAGVPCDFRLDYGRHIGKKALLVSVNRSKDDLYRNRKPDIALQGDPGRFLHRLSDEFHGPDEQRWAAWFEKLRARDRERDAEIARQAAEPTEALNPLALCLEIEQQAERNSILVADGGDFVGTASYIVRPRGPLTWLDPGVFGTLGVGGGFALGAKLCRPDAEVWILYGDGSCAYSLAEFDTFVRHKVPVIAVVGNDACWMQIAREQVDVLGDDVGCELRHTDYHTVAEGFGGCGFLLQKPDETSDVLRRAREAAREGHPVLVNAHLGRTDFRKGSISM